MVSGGITRDVLTPKIELSRVSYLCVRESSQLSRHVAVEHGLRDAGLGQAQVGGGGLAGARPSGSEPGGGRRRQRARRSPTPGRRADHCVVSQRGKTERADRHRPQDLPGVKNKAVAERAEAHEQLGPPYVHVWVAFLRSLAATKGMAPEHVSVVKSYWENIVVKSEPVQLAAHAWHCRAKPCKKVEGKDGWMRIVFCLDPVTLPLEGALEAALRLQTGVRKRGWSAKRRGSWHRCGGSRASCPSIGATLSSYG